MWASLRVCSDKAWDGQGKISELYCEAYECFILRLYSTVMNPEYEQRTGSSFMCLRPPGTERGEVRRDGAGSGVKRRKTVKKGKGSGGEESVRKAKTRKGMVWTGVGEARPFIPDQVEAEGLIERGRGTSAMVKGFADPTRSPHSCRLMAQAILVPHRY